MTNSEKAAASKLKYSEQAKQLLESLKDEFDFKSFEVWIKETQFIVGGGHIVNFLLETKSKSNP